MNRLLAALLLIILVVPLTCYAQITVGGGAKLVGEVPFLIANIIWGPVGAEAGVGMNSSGILGYSLSYFWYSANGKVYIFIPSLRAYLGAGIIGIKVTASVLDQTGSGSSIGVDVLGGLEFPLGSYGIPLTVFGGIDWLMFSNLTVSIAGQHIEFPLDVSGLSFHVGIRLEF